MEPIHTYPIEIVAAATPVTIDVTDRYPLYRIFTQAAVILLGNQSIAIGGGTIPEGVQLTFIFGGGNIDLNGNTFTIFGVTITQEMLDAGFILIVYYDGTTYNTVININSNYPNSIPTSALVDATSITTAMADQHVQDTDQFIDFGGPSQMSAAEIRNQIYKTICIPLSWDANQVGALNKIVMSGFGIIANIHLIANTAFAAGDNCRVNFDLNGAVLTPKSLIIPDASAQNYVTAVPVIAGNTFVDGDELNCTTSIDGVGVPGAYYGLLTIRYTSI